MLSVMSRSNLCSARKMLVFVYGTLKSGQPNHNLIKEETRGTCVSVGTAVTREKYPLVVASRYNVPYLLYKPGTGQNVQGEIYEVDSERLQILDELERHPVYYERHQIDVELLGPSHDKNTGAKAFSCEAYFLVEFLDDLLKLPMYKSYSDNHNGLSYVKHVDRPTDVTQLDWWGEVHKGYKKSESL